ncbi:hypothetical protein FQZ97_1010610 [compost metagenome]
MSAFWYMPQGERSWASICSPSVSAASGSVARAFGTWAAASAGTPVAGAVAAGWLTAAGTAWALGSSAKEALGASIRLISRAASRRGGREAIVGWALRMLGFMLAGPEG